MASNNNNFDLEPDNVSKVKEMKFGIVVSNWNKNITNNLFDGAYKTLIKYGVKEANIKKIEVPGSFELVYGCKRMQNKNVDAVILVTEWKEFRSPDFNKMSDLMSQQVFIDGRNQFSKDQIERKGFEYFQIGVK